MTRLLLVRHGETVWNSAKRLQGQEDIPLSEAGERQARALAPRVRAFAPTTVVSSDLLRTRQTAAALGYAPPELRLDPRLREGDLGAWVGRSAEELIAHAAGDYHAWRAGRFTPPDAESFEVLGDRVQRALEDALGEGGTVLVVTHGGVVRAALARLLGLYPEKIVPVSPASLTILEVGAQVRLHSYNLTGYEARGAVPD